MSDDGPTIKPAPYAAWRIPAFRFYAISWFLVMFSKMIESVAVGANLYAQTNDPLSLAWVGLVQAAPVMLLAIAGGQIADRFNRRTVILCTLAASVFASLGMFLRAFNDWPIEWMYVFLGIAAVCQAIGGPSRSSILPQIVPLEHFNNAVTWNSTVFQIAMMTGPAVGGLICGTSANNQYAAAAFAAVFVCRTFSFLAMLCMKSPGNRAELDSISLQSVIAGIRFVSRTKLILATITMDLFAVLFGGLTYLLPVFASKEYLDVGTTGQGFLRSAEAVGAVCMAMLIAHLPPMKRAGRTLLWAVGGFGAATIVFGVSAKAASSASVGASGFSFWFWLCMATMFFIGALDNISVVVRHTLVQMLTPDAMRGRVSAVNNVFIVASNDLGGFESGLTAKLFGPILSVAAGGICTILVVLGSVKIWPEILSIGSLQDVKPADLAEAEEELADRGT